MKPRPESKTRLVRLTVTTRWVTICAGIIFGLLRTTPSHFAVAAIALVAFAAFQSFFQLRPDARRRAPGRS